MRVPLHLPGYTWVCCIKRTEGKGLMAQKLTLKDLMERAVELFELARRNPGELAEQMHTNSVAVEVLQNGLAAYIKQKKSEIPTAPDLFEPKVTATFSGWHDPMEDIDVTVWFVLA